MKTKTLTLLFSTLIVLFSCSKTSIEIPLQENKIKINNALKFNNYAEFIQIWNAVTSNDATGINNILKTQFNYASFAEEADDFYDSIDWESFNTSEEMINFLNAHQIYFSISQDDEGDMLIEPVVSNNLMRMFMNEDRLFQIGDSVFRVFEKVTIGTNTSNIQVFEGINESNIAQIIGNDDVFIFSEQGFSMQLKDGAHHCGFQQSKTETNDRERVKMEITVGYLHVGGGQYGPPATNEWTHLSIKGYRKTFGIWFNVMRTISCDVKIATGYYNWNSNTWIRRIGTHATSGTFKNHLSEILTSEWASIGFWANPISHFDGYNCWGKIPATSQAVLKCNEHLVN